jgi:hypothetical protein
MKTPHLMRGDFSLAKRNSAPNVDALWIAQ